MCGCECPGCGAHLTALASPGCNEAHPGAVVVCYRCRSVLLLTEQFRLRLPDMDELDYLLTLTPVVHLVQIAARLHRDTKTEETKSE